MFAWWFKHKNFGDAINPILIKFISGETPKNLRSNLYGIFKQLVTKEPVYIVVGSTLHRAADKNSIIWGAGFISYSGKLKEKPRKIYAVRGPLSREIIIKQGFDCPEVYGDPALLLPRFYKPNVEKIYKIGLIPHYLDKDNPVIDKFKQSKDLLIIDIFSGMKKVINDILSCEKIASSCLHGIIVADAYGIQSTWLKFSDKVIGDGFKFRDYFMSVGRKDREPLVVTEKTTIEDIYKNFYDYKIYIDLDKLLEVCPFKK